MDAMVLSDDWMGQSQGMKTGAKQQQAENAVAGYMTGFAKEVMERGERGRGELNM